MCLTSFNSMINQVAYQRIVHRWSLSLSSVFYSSNCTSATMRQQFYLGKKIMMVNVFSLLSVSPCIAGDYWGQHVKTMRFHPICQLKTWTLNVNCMHNISLGVDVLGAFYWVEVFQCLWTMTDSLLWVPPCARNRDGRHEMPAMFIFYTELHIYIPKWVWKTVPANKWSFFLYFSCTVIVFGKNVPQGGHKVTHQY